MRKRQERVAQLVPDGNTLAGIVDAGASAIARACGPGDEIEHHEGIAGTLRHLGKPLEQRGQIEHFHAGIGGEEIRLEHENIYSTSVARCESGSCFRGRFSRTGTLPGPQTVVSHGVV